MKMHRRRNGIIALAFLLGLSLFLWSGTKAAYAMRASDFTDVKTGYWGYSYIDFSADNGVINGYLSPDGTYRFLPEKAVSKEESMVMLYRTLSATAKLESQEDFTAEYTELFAENIIAQWAQKYIAYGLKYGLITKEELVDFTDENGYGISAPREQVALWAAKAMGRKFAPAYSLIYVDKDSITAEKLPYIDLLYRHGIMQGDDTKMFHPANSIKRVEFAAICNRVYESSKTDHYTVEKEVQSYRGTIVSVDTYSSRVMMTQSDGTSRVIQINPKTQIVIDGRVNYNGLGGISTGTTAVVAWGAFYDSNSNSSSENILQFHVITKSQTRTGLLSEIEKMDDSTSIIKVENADGDILHYVLDEDSQMEGTPQKGKEITIIVDGIKILELK